MIIDCENLLAFIRRSSYGGRKERERGERKKEKEGLETHDDINRRLTLDALGHLYAN